MDKSRSSGPENEESPTLTSNNLNTLHACLANSTPTLRSPLLNMVANAAPFCSTAKISSRSCRSPTPKPWDLFRSTENPFSQNTQKSCRRGLSAFWMTSAARHYRPLEAVQVTRGPVDKFYRLRVPSTAGIWARSRMLARMPRLPKALVIVFYLFFSFSARTRCAFDALL